MEDKETKKAPEEDEEELKDKELDQVTGGEGGYFKPIRPGDFFPR